MNVHAAERGNAAPLSYRAIFSLWWPLAASWFIMSFEHPTVVTFVSRLADAKLNLAAFCGVAFPIAMFIEAPIMPFLSVSTALCTTYERYRKVRQWMIGISVLVTTIHIMIGTTPLFRVIVEDLLGAPQELHALIRVTLIVMIPWSSSIAYRRFCQGLLIRAGRSRDIGVGTFIRIVMIALTLAIGTVFELGAGAVLAGVALIAGVVAEAAYNGIRVQGEIARLKETQGTFSEVIEPRSFLLFYLPLALSIMIHLTVQPMGSAGMSRMPEALNSLAVWGAVGGLSFMARSFGVALIEVHIALLGYREAERMLWHFAWIVGFCSTCFLFLFSGTPLALEVFSKVFGLGDTLGQLGAAALLIGLPAPLIGALACSYQGYFTFTKRTHFVTEGVIVFVSVAAAVILGGVYLNRFAGVLVVSGGLTTAFAAQLLWYALRSRKSIATIP